MEGGDEGSQAIPLSLSPHSVAPGWGLPCRWDWWASGKCVETQQGYVRVSFPWWMWWVFIDFKMFMYIIHSYIRLVGILGTCRACCVLGGDLHP